MATEVIKVIQHVEPTMGVQEIRRVINFLGCTQNRLEEAEAWSKYLSAYLRYEKAVVQYEKDMFKYENGILSQKPNQPWLPGPPLSANFPQPKQKQRPEQFLGAGRSHNPFQKVLGNRKGSTVKNDIDLPSVEIPAELSDYFDYQ
jgi:hypothetical protein